MLEQFSVGSTYISYKNWFLMKKM